LLANQIGYYSLILGLLFSFLLCTIAIRDFNKVNKKLNENIIILTFLQLIFVIISFFSLILSFINSDFSNETVFNNSHTTKPLFYKISGTWGNHEGSLLLWLLVLTLFIFLFLLNFFHRFFWNWWKKFSKNRKINNNKSLIKYTKVA
jgi:cytochrome c-type biogenesis protein CcmF